MSPRQTWVRSAKEIFVIRRLLVRGQEKPGELTAAGEIWGRVARNWGTVPRNWGRAAQFWGRVPRFRGRVPQDGGDVPQFWGGVPRFGGSVPRKRGSLPSFRGGVPRFGGSLAQFGAAVPRAFQIPRPIRSRFRKAAIWRASWTVSRSSSHAC